MTTVMRPDFGVMDAAWLNALDEKTYLFAVEWPVSAWALNLAYPGAIGLIYRRRRLTDRTAPAEGIFVAGLFALVGTFLVSSALAEAGITAVVQLQVSRIFWVLGSAPKNSRTGASQPVNGRSCGS